MPASFTACMMPRPVRAGGREHDVDALRDLRLGQLGAAGRVGPGRGRVAGHARPPPRPSGWRSARPARSRRRTCAPAARPCRRRSRPCRSCWRAPRHADQEAALVLAVDEALHVGQVDHRVDDREAASVGKSRATFSIADACGKPMPTTASRRAAAKRRAACSRCAAFLISNSRYGLPPVSRFQRSAPSKAAWLKELVELAAELEDHRRLGAPARARPMAERGSGA